MWQHSPFLCSSRDLTIADSQSRRPCHCTFSVKALVRDSRLQFTTTTVRLSSHKHTTFVCNIQHCTLLAFRPHSIKVSLPSLYPQRHSRDKISQAFRAFRTASDKAVRWPGNEASNEVQLLLLPHFITDLHSHTCTQAAETCSLVPRPHLFR